jgi:Cytochrome c7 and related cytochrome c/Class III cytochrome C family
MQLRWAPMAAILFMMGAAALRSQQPPAQKVARTPPVQPIPFSHKTHVAQGLNCKQCHPIPEPGDFATIPKTSFCMGCHASVKKESPHIAKLAGLHAENKRVPWVPVYRVPDWVSFSHKRHLAAEGVQCETCHGPVQEREALHRERDISMSACMDCHRARNVSNECLLCHDQR